VITAVVLGGVDIFGGSGTMPGVLLAVLVLAFAQNTLGLAGITPEQQQIATGAILVVTLVIFSSGDFYRRLKDVASRYRTPGAARGGA
jgi:rhamnose transport system permease protein